jgi:hypothetical protein
VTPPCTDGARRHVEIARDLRREALQQVAIHAKCEGANIDPKSAAILTMRSTCRLRMSKQILFDRLSRSCPDLIHLRSIALRFREAPNEKRGLPFIVGLPTSSSFGTLVRFGYGLKKDISAVTPAIETEWSNGQVVHMRLRFCDRGANRRKLCRFQRNSVRGQRCKVSRSGVPAVCPRGRHRL